MQKAYDGILKERDATEKQQRAREAREKQERERLERAAKKKALVDFNAPDDQEGVMDSLLEALKTGSAFNREQKRKRAPRAAGGKRIHCTKYKGCVQCSYKHIVGSFVNLFFFAHRADPALLAKLDQLIANHDLAG